MTAEMFLVIGVILMSTAFGVYRRRTDGSIKTPEAGSFITAEQLGHDMGTKATVIQFSSPYCQPCKATNTMVDEMTSGIESVAHVDLQVADHLDLVNQLKIMRTPTTILLDGNGHIEFRIEGLPKRDEIESALESVLNK